jgi:hypothetical protein
MLLPSTSKTRIFNREPRADHLGLTIETASRGFGQLKRQGIIALPTANRVLILKLEALERLQEGHDD